MSEYQKYWNAEIEKLILELEATYDPVLLKISIAPECLKEYCVLTADTFLTKEII